ncbi:MAG: hypothetical protein R2698_07680 [Microthrixaceae bacterium]
MRIVRDGGLVHVEVDVIVAGRTSRLRHTIRTEDPAILTRTTVDVPGGGPSPLQCILGNLRRGSRCISPAVWSSDRCSAGTAPPSGRCTPSPWHTPAGAASSSASARSPTAGTAAQTGTGVALGVGVGTPTGVHVGSGGSTEVIVARTAVKEVAFGVVPVMAPAWGWRWGTQHAVSVWGWQEPDRFTDVVDLGRHLVGCADRAVGWPRFSTVLEVDDHRVEVIAVKPADRGDGIVARLRNWAPSSTPRTVTVSPSSRAEFAFVGACVSDARERDIGPLAVVDGRVEVPVARHLTTIRLHTRSRR